LPIIPTRLSKHERKIEPMKTKLLTAALLASAALIAQAQAGGGHHGGGGNFAVAAPPPAVRGGAAPSVHSMPLQRFGSGPMIYPAQRFSSIGMHAPSYAVMRPSYIHSTLASIGSRPSTPATMYRDNRITRAPTTGNRAIVSPQRRTSSAVPRNGNHLPTNWRNHVVAQHPANWHRDWDRHSDHWWHGRRCHFFNGSWLAFDFGFYPSWPYWYYPYDYYAYSYPYPYYYYQPYYYDSGYQNEGYYGQSSYGDASSNSIVAAAQQELARQGYYRGEIDGVLGQETRRALLRYQRSHGLRVTGGATADTLRSLGLRQFASY
jgi:Putative peptidoglycan binding domain